MISAIVVAAIIFSYLTYQYYIKNSSQVQNIAVGQIKNTTQIKASDLSDLLRNKLDLVNVNLQILSSSQELIDQRVDVGKILLNAAQKTTANVVDFYNWVDGNGTIIWSSSKANNTGYVHFKEFSTAAQLYFKKAKDTQAPVYSNKLKLTDGRSGILITYPIIDTHSNTINKNRTNEEFKGAVLAGISSDTLTSLPRGSVADNKKEQTIVNVIRHATIKPRTGSADIESDGKSLTIAYSPVISKGIHYFTVILTLPHTLASTLDDLVEQQRNFAIV